MLSTRPAAPECSYALELGLGGGGRAVKDSWGGGVTHVGCLEAQREPDTWPWEEAPRGARPGAPRARPWPGLLTGGLPWPPLGPTASTQDVQLGQKTRDLSL